ncbi:MAG: hypothetical protein R6W76_21610 [Caldilinea sp.]
MTTMHLGIEELIARQQMESMRRSDRHAWHFTEFWRRERRPASVENGPQWPAWAGELVELSISQARWAMI